MVNKTKAGNLLNLGADEFAKGNYQKAIKYFKESIIADPNFLDGYFNLSLVYQKLGNQIKTIYYLKKVLKLNSNDNEAKLIIANNYYHLGDYKNALKYQPNYPEAITALGSSLAREGNFQKALQLYQQSLSLDENYSTTYVFLGNIFLAQGNLNDAIMCYKMAIEKDKNNKEAFNNLGTAYARLQKYGDAIRAYKKSDSLNNLAMAYASAKKTKQALNYFKKSFAKNPNDSLTVANLFFQMREAAEWDGIHDIESKLDELTKGEIVNGCRTGEDPFINVIRSQDSKFNLNVAESWSKEIERQIHKRKPFKTVAAKNKKIRIGYISAHFHDHPTSQLSQGLFTLFNKNLFEVFIYSLGPNDNSSYYKCIQNLGTNFTDLYGSNFSDAATKINNDNIDILVDLDGYTDNNKLEIMALRPAKIQITYLGFPGTLGANFIDYIIADKVIVPKSNEKYFSEKIIFMPGTYQINNNQQKVSQVKYSRKDFGLPEAGFVFASFNGTYKIEPNVFDIWMNVIKKVDQSVLWLLGTNPLAEKNLLHEAEKRGVDPKRIIFTKRLPHDKHLARLKLADLILDTFTCTGHTSTSDAIFAGKPVLTLLGKHFASRVSASLLTAIGRAELIAHSEDEYEKMAISMGNSHKLPVIEPTPLFDTETFVKNLENIYQKIIIK